LRQLEEERLQLDRELNFARNKIMVSEKSKEVLEAQLRVSKIIRNQFAYLPDSVVKLSGGIFVGNKASRDNYVTCEYDIVSFVTPLVRVDKCTKTSSV
jgi:hypothetical protein